MGALHQAMRRTCFGINARFEWVASTLILIYAAVLLTPMLRAQSIEFAGLRSATGSGLSAPVGVAVDLAGNIYIADVGLNQVVDVMAAGGQSSVGTALGTTSAVAVDLAGNIFIADTSYN